MDHDISERFKDGEIVFLDSLLDDGVGWFKSERFPKIEGCLIGEEITSLKID